jgi:UDP-N-acetylglucosamine--N-acetylmuramyl-(pentapeptide) pyrophosphoryl-undecaprenol N-acetylglucosamine transferase
MLLAIRPHLVFSKGGSGSIAVVFCAKLLGIPIFIHESDFSPGLSNKMASKWAEKIFISFAKTEFFDLTKAILAGNPIRKELLEGSPQIAKQLFNLTFEKPIILFLGGSQGAEFINNFVLANLNDMLKEYEVIHVTGPENFQQTRAESAVAIPDKELQKYYHIAGFLDEEKLKHAYSACDFIVSRSGSGSIFEISALGKPSVLIPLPTSASDHQSKNAYVYSQQGAGIFIEQNNLTKNFFLEKVRYILSNQDKLNEMKTSALEFSKPMAAKTIAREILEYLMLE